LNATNCSVEEEFWSIYEFLLRCGSQVELKLRQNTISFPIDSCTIVSLANECLTSSVPSCYDDASNERWGHISSQLLAFTKNSLDLNGINEFKQCSVEQLGALWRLGETPSPLTSEDVQAAVQEVSVKILIPQYE